MKHRPNSLPRAKLSGSNGHKVLVSTRLKLPNSKEQTVQFSTRLKLPSSKEQTVQFSTRLNSLDLKDTQSNEIASQAISYPGFDPRFQMKHRPNLNCRLHSPVIKDTQSKSQQIYTGNFSARIIQRVPIFKFTIDSILNQLAKISARHVSSRTQTTSNTVIKAESQSTSFIQIAQVTK